MVAGSPIDIAILGTGHMAGIYRDAIFSIPDARLSMVYGSDIDRARALAGDSDVEAVAELEAVLGSPNVDAVVVANQPQRHVIAVDAIRAGKHVLVEKPLAATMEDANAILDASRASAVVVSGVFQMRLGKDVKNLIDTVSSGRVGRLRGIDAIGFGAPAIDHDPAGRHWRSDRCGGVILNRLVHHIDVMRSLAGEVHSVFATTRASSSDPAVDAEATVVLEFADQLSGVIRGSYAAGPATMFTVYGDRGSIQLRDGDMYASDDAAADTLLPGRKANLRRALGRGRERTRRSPGRARDQIQDFLAAIAGGRQPGVTIEDSHRALVIALAAHESASTGRAVDVGGGPG